MFTFCGTRTSWAASSAPPDLTPWSTGSAPPDLTPPVSARVKTADSETRRTYTHPQNWPGVTGSQEQFPGASVPAHRPTELLVHRVR